MISLLSAVPSGPQSLLLTFSDGTSGEWDAADVLAHDTALTRPLADSAYFARAFVEGGDALAWPNGLELSARSLHRELGGQGKLFKKAA